MLTIVMTGATGFIGRHLVSHFLEAGEAIRILTRSPGKAQKLFGSSVSVYPWDAVHSGDWEAALIDADVVIHLAGASIARYWTAGYREQIRQSRVQSTSLLVDAMTRRVTGPLVFCQMSATGIYGNRGDEVITEQTAPGKGFLAEVVREWEAAGECPPDRSIRRVVLRSGVVLGRDGGFLPRMEWPMRLFLGGYPGSGKQWFSWIHVDEIYRILQFFIRQPDASGVYNLVAPEPLPLREFCQTLGTILKRPCWMPIPATPLKLLLREMAEEMIFTSQRVLPQRLIQQGYTFQFPTLLDALKDLYSRQ
ncbi:MAG: TIGR01777 family protein [Calditrichaeota bacterium]|nr:TIGR01777 family protein [Calditrichota bacterium]